MGKLEESIKGLRDNSLTNLDLRDNNIGTEGANALATVLKENSSLTNLDLSGNNIGDEGVNALATVLKENSSLTSLDLGGNNIGDEAGELIDDIITRNRNIRDNFLTLAKGAVGRADQQLVLLEGIKEVPTVHQSYAVVALIEEASESYEQSLDITNHLKVIKLFLDSGLPVNTTILQAAIKTNNPQIKELIPPGLTTLKPEDKSLVNLKKQIPATKPLILTPILTTTTPSKPEPKSPQPEQSTLEQQITKLQLQHQKAEEEIARISNQQLSSKSPFSPSPSTIDPKFTKTKADIAEQEHIKSKPHLLQYYNIIQKTFNEAFLFSNILSQGGVVLSQGAVARSLGAMATLAGDIPFASVILSIAQSATDSFTSAKRAGKYTNISDLNPNSDPIDSALLVEELARRFTITNAAKIESIAAGRGAAELSDIRQFISRVKEDTKAQIAKQDPAMARGLFGTEKTSAELLAYKDSRTALEYILNGQLQDKSSRTTIIKEIVEAVTGLEEKRLITTIPPSTTQIKKSATTTSLITPSIVNPTSVPTPELSPIIQGASQLSSGTDIERILRITEDRAKAREKAHAEEIKKALEDQAKMLEEKMRKAQEEQAKAHTEAIRKLRAVEAESGQTKKTLEAVFQTVISGNDDQVTGAVRTREGATISVINPNLEARVSGIHQEHDEHREEVHNRLSHLERERSRRSKKSKTKCCVIL